MTNNLFGARNPSGTARSCAFIVKLYSIAGVDKSTATQIKRFFLEDFGKIKVCYAL